MNRRTLLAGLVARSAGTDAPPITPSFGRLTFEDTFQSFDRQRYMPHFAWGGRWLGEEAEVYVDPVYRGTASAPLALNPFSIQNGVLQIQADRAPRHLAAYLQGKSFTSGMLTTFNSFAQYHGYFELEAKVPFGKGFWPAFWLMPRNGVAYTVEIDVMEILCDAPSKLYVTAHWSASGSRRKKGFAIDIPDASQDFHRYGLLWTERFVAWYFDRQRVAYIPTPPGFEEPMYMLVNLAVGGQWPGYPTADTPFPGNFLIKSLRAYEV